MTLVDDVLALLRAGHTNVAIARQLHIRTVRVSDIRKAAGLAAVKPGPQGATAVERFQKIAQPTDDGHLLCCDVNEEWTAIARKHWERAGVDDKIELRIAPAIETLRSLPAGERFDLAFIDADKPNYPHYYEEVLARLRPNCVILVDNTLWGGAVADPKATDDNTKAIRAFNDAVAADERVESTILTVGDGLTLIRKR